MGWNIFFAHCPHVFLALPFARESEEDSAPQLAGGVRQATRVDTRQITNTFINEPGIVPHRCHDTVELSQLGKQHAAAEFIHAELRRDKPLQARLAQYFLMRRPESTQVMESGCALEEQRIMSDDGPTFSCGDGFVQLQAVDADVPDRSEWTALVTCPDALGTI